MSSSAGQGLRVLWVTLVSGMLLGSCVFVAAKVLRPEPVDPMDVDFWDVVGTRVPEVEMMGLRGGVVSSRRYAGQGHVLFFSHPGCPACDEIYPQLRETERQIPVLMVFREGLAEAREKAEAIGFEAALAYDSLEALTEPLHVEGYPTAMFVDADGRIVKAAVGTLYAVRVMDFAIEQTRQGAADGQATSFLEGDGR